jgi:hypothetical protein
MYIGHTTDFERRFNNHKLRCNHINNNIKGYNFIRENGGWENWNMIKIENFSCNNKKEAEERERYWIDELKSSLNMKIPSRTKKEICEASRKNAREYYKKNTNKIKEYQKKYNIENADKVKERHKEYHKEYYLENVDKIKEKDRKYREQNTDIIKEKDRKYREQNANIIKEKAKESITCECGCELRKDTLKRHQKSQKHKNLLEKLITNNGLTNSIVSN